MITVKQDSTNGKLFENLEVGTTFKFKDELLIKIGTVKTLYDMTCNAVGIINGVLYSLGPTDIVFPFDAELIIKKKES